MEMIRFFKVVPVAVVAAGAAVAVAAAAVASPAPPRAPRMSAVTLANGVLFNQGPAVHYLTALGRPKAPVRGKLLAVERSVDQALRDHPTLASAFARNIQSGNRIQVRAALESLGSLARAAYQNQYGAAATERVVAQAKATLAHPATPLAGSSSGSGTASTELVAVFFYVVAVVAAVVVLLAFWAPTRGQPGNLAAERIVSQIAVGLHAR